MAKKNSNPETQEAYDAWFAVKADVHTETCSRVQGKIYDFTCARCLRLSAQRAKRLAKISSINGGRS
jgi:hypothetical protein